MREWSERAGEVGTMADETIMKGDNRGIPLNEVFKSKMELTESEAVRSDYTVLATVQGPFAEIGKGNRNDRYYSRGVFENKVINSEYVKELLDNNCFFGELGHPENRMEIDFANVSHAITKLWITEDGSTLMGKLDILDTPMGKIANTFFKYGSNVGISARAVGSVETKDGVDYVSEEDYVFRTFDLVPVPGFRSSRVSAIKESMEDDSDVKNIVKDLKRQVKGGSTALLESMKKVCSLSENKEFKKLEEKVEEELNRRKAEITESVKEVSYISLLEQRETEINALKSQIEVLSSELSEEKRVNIELRESLEAKDDYYLNERMSSAIREVDSEKEKLYKLSEELELEKESSRKAGELYLSMKKRCELMERNIKKAGELVKRERGQSELAEENVKRLAAAVKKYKNLTENLVKENRTMQGQIHNLRALVNKTKNPTNGFVDNKVAIKESIEVKKAATPLVEAVRKAEDTPVTVTKVEKTEKVIEVKDEQEILMERLFKKVR